jgi:alkyl hydroperoxide reductase subunit AhpC
LAEIQKNYDTYTKFNTRVFALSTDSPKQSENIIKRIHLSFTLLCDEDRKVVDMFKLRNPFEHGGIAYPATFIINPEGKICYRSLDGTANRVDLTDELSFLEQIHSDAGHSMQTKPKKSWVVPSLKDTWRMSMNMISRGNLADWKHFLLLPVNMLRIIGSKIGKR